MAKAFRVLSVGLAATVLASVIGCSQAPESEKPAASGDTTEQTTPADEPAANEAETEGSTAKVAPRQVENVTLPAPTEDPMAAVFQLRQYSGEPIGSERIQLNFPSPDQAVVTKVVRGLQDDSVKALRVRYEFTAADGSTDGKQLWQLSQVTEENICQLDRGPQEWSGELCQ